LTLMVGLELIVVTVMVPVTATPLMTAVAVTVDAPSVVVRVHATGPKLPGNHHRYRSGWLSCSR